MCKCVEVEHNTSSALADLFHFCDFYAIFTLHHLS